MTMRASKAPKLTPLPSAVFGEWYVINGKSASPEDAEVMAARGLPLGDYWVANDFVRKLRAVPGTELRRRNHIRASVH